MKCLICGEATDELTPMTYKGKPSNDEACNSCSTLFEALSWLTENEVARIDEKYWLYNNDAPVPDEVIIEAAERKKLANANKKIAQLKRRKKKHGPTAN